MCLATLNEDSRASCTCYPTYKGDFCRFIIPFGFLIKVHTLAVILFSGSCLILLVIPALWGWKSGIKKDGSGSGILFPFGALTLTLNFPCPHFPFSLCLRCFLSVSHPLSLSLSHAERNTQPPLLNIVKVSDGVILKGQCVPPLPKFVTAVVVISSMSSSFPSYLRLSAATVPAGHRGRRVASSLRREAAFAFMLQRLHAWRDDREREKV